MLNFQTSNGIFKPGYYFYENNAVGYRLIFKYKKNYSAEESRRLNNCNLFLTLFKELPAAATTSAKQKPL